MLLLILPGLQSHAFVRSILPLGGLGQRLEQVSKWSQVNGECYCLILNRLCRVKSNPKLSQTEVLLENATKNHLLPNSIREDHIAIRTRSYKQFWCSAENKLIRWAQKSIL